MTLRYDTITFLSDYGTTDEFVGVCHSVARQIAPAVVVIDLIHDLPAHDVRAAGLALGRSVQYLAPGVVVAVVDPGVGTSRRAVAVEVGDGQSVLVGPDNGLLAPAVGMCGGATRVVELTNPELQLAAPGSTFAGRDIFMPAGAHLCAGVPMEMFGAEIDPALLVPSLVPLCQRESDELKVEALWIDHFGNVQLNAGPDDVADLGPVVELKVGNEVRTAELVAHYEAIPPGRVGLVVDSYGMLSVAACRTSAAAMLRLDTGSALTLTAAR